MAYETPEDRERRQRDVEAAIRAGIALLGIAGFIGLVAKILSRKSRKKSGGRR